MFINVVMNTLGLQTIVATDIFDGSITGLGAVMVVGADIKLLKEPKLTVAASADIIRFRVCWSNYSSASGTDVVITDAVPVGTTYVPDAASDALCTPVAGVNVITSYSISTSPTMPPAIDFITISGAAQPPGGPSGTGARWMRWTVDMIGVWTTGCLCYRVRVD